jgi:DnaJ-domain-containing protein 1
MSGPFAGRRLSELSLADMRALHAQCRASDPEAAIGLEHDLDRRFPGWRAAGQGDADARDRGGARRRYGEMSEQEAYQTLGLRPGADADEIVRAHRSLMKERHPDHGGTTDDAARINQAKDRLLRRHG